MFVEVFMCMCYVRQVSCVVQPCSMFYCLCFNHIHARGMPLVRCTLVVMAAWQCECIHCGSNGTPLRTGSGKTSLGNTWHTFPWASLEVRMVAVFVVGVLVLTKFPICQKVTLSVDKLYWGLRIERGLHSGRSTLITSPDLI